MPDEVRLLDNRNALLFVRGERAIRDEKYDLLCHPNIHMTTDGGSAQYVHGQTPLALDIGDVLLDGDYEDYVILSEEELDELIEKNKQEEKQNEET